MTLLDQLAHLPVLYLDDNSTTLYETLRFAEVRIGKTGGPAAGKQNLALEHCGLRAYMVGDVSIDALADF